jgi:hypothetical protein
MTQRQPQAEARDDRSLGQLLSELTQEIVTLVRQEMTLAKTEMSQKVSHVGAQAGILAAGGALAYAGVLALVGALVLFLVQAGMKPWLSALIVGAAVALTGGLLVGKAIAAIKNADMAPRETLDSLKQLKDEIQ